MGASCDARDCGRVLQSLGRLDDAEKMLRKAIGLDPELVFAWNELGFVVREKGHFEAAAFCFEQSAVISECPYVFTVLANTQSAFDSEAAIESAKRALELDPDWE